MGYLGKKKMGYRIYKLGKIKGVYGKLKLNKLMGYWERKLYIFVFGFIVGI